MGASVSFRPTYTNDFRKELGGKCCAMLRPFYHKIDEENSCKEIYRKGAELAVEVALSAPDLVPECKMPRALRGIVKRFPGGGALGKKGYH